jgi:FtsZ-binding cell division protein ZapB
MINLEQVKLLETKVAKAVDYVEYLAKENTAMHRQETELQTRLESYQKRIDELEVLVMGFKEDQGKIEEGILAALDRLSQFEKAIEKSLRDKPAAAKAAAKEPAAHSAKPSHAAALAAVAEADGSANGQTCFEIPEASAEALPDSADSPPQGGNDISDPLENTPDNKPAADAAAEGGELDIF